MKRSIIFLLLAVVLAGGAIGVTSGPCSAQGYYPVQPVAMTPYVGNNTPWTFYKGDWFLNGVLNYFFGPKIGFAPYYAYPQVYIVRPGNWYAPGWNAWYQARPQYWNNFERQYPQWRGHQMGRHYDENFYNRYNRGQGGGWNRGFQGAGTTGPGYHPQGGTTPGYHPQGTANPGYRPQGGTGTVPGYRPQGGTTPGYHPQGGATPGYHPQGGTTPGYHPQGGATPGYHPQGGTGTTPAYRPKTPPTPTGGGKPGTPPPHDEHHQQ
ncbi:MAG: hypothetical protein ACLPPL_07075 [Desulfobaccales bacterium]